MLLWLGEQLNTISPNAHKTSWSLPCYSEKNQNRNRRCLEPDHHADFRPLLVRHLLQRTTAHNRQQKTTFVSQFITQVLTKPSVNFNQGLRATPQEVLCALREYIIL